MYSDGSDGTDGTALKELLERIARNALAGSVGTDATSHAQRARDLLGTYLGASYDGDDERRAAGESVIVDRTVFETVEGTLAGLMEMFHGQELAVEAEPAGDDPADVMLAEAQTAYANMVYLRDNCGYAVSYAVLKSALISGEGIWRVAAETRARQTRRRYSSLGATAFQALLSESGAVLEKGEASMDGTGLVNAVVKRIWSETRIVVEAVPPEEMRWLSDTRSPEEANFIAREYPVMRADLTALGFDPDVVTALPSAARSYNDTASVRSGVTTEAFEDDPSVELVDIAECYIRADLDRDGIPEWWQVWMATGAQAVCIGYEEVDCHPFVIASPRPMPFSISGMGQAETVEDVQRVRTQTLRMMLDRLYRSTQGRLLVRQNSPAWEHLAAGAPMIPSADMADVRAIDESADIGDLAQAFDSMRQVGEARAGVGPTSAGLNPNMLQGNVAASAVERVMSAAERQVLMIARTMAERGFREVFRRIIELSMRHQDQPRRLRLSGRMVEIDPREWTQACDLVINVGLGTGDRALRVAGLMQILGIQREALGNGLPGVTPVQVHATVRELVRALQLPNPGSYWVAPAEVPPAQPAVPVDPTQDPQYRAMVDVAQIEQRGALQRQDLKEQAALQRELVRDDRERDRAEIEAMLESAQIGQPLNLELLRFLNSVPRADAGGTDGLA